VRLVRDILAAFRALPLAGIESLLGSCRPLILAPHPDDESLGCGGLIAAACAAGMPPAVAILTDGSASHPCSRSYPPERLAALRETEARAALSILGLPAGKLFFLREPDTKLAGRGAVIDRLCDIARLADCRMVIGPWAGDPHCDHEAAAAIAEAVAARGGDTLLADASTVGWRLDISRWRNLKAKAIAAHESQYGALITDSPDGFELPKSLLDVFAQPYEVFLAP
jgi:LmbE family N-acetylglucosaminyl deacetylase